MCDRHELNEAPDRLGSRYHVEVGDLDFVQNTDVRPTGTNPAILLHDRRRIASMRKSGGRCRYINVPLQLEQLQSSTSRAVRQLSQRSPHTTFVGVTRLDLLWFRGRTARIATWVATPRCARHCRDHPNSQTEQIPVRLTSGSVS
jgi:hypothetical protein